MDKRAVIFGKKVVGRKETLEYASKKFGWKNVSIGISCSYGLLAWIFGRLTGRKVIYYCIDFYSPLISDGFFDSILILCSMLLDKFLVKHCDIKWDISERINEGRYEYGNYVANSKIVPLCYPETYFRFEKNPMKKRIVFVGLDPYGLELIGMDMEFEWVGRDKKLPIDELVEYLSKCGIGLSMWNWKGNNYYGDPGKTKLYSACGLPVIMTDNTPYAEIIKKTGAGVVIPYGKTALKRAVAKILSNYDHYKSNVKKTWTYINADILSNPRLLD